VRFRYPQYRSRARPGLWDRWIAGVNVYRVDGDKIAEIDIFDANQYEVDEFFG